jgi:hypothetical protein
MSRENPLWGAPYIHGELLKLGIDVGTTSVRGAWCAYEDRPPDLENVPGETFVDFLRGANDSLSRALRIPGPGSPPSPHPTSGGDGASEGGMGRAATAGGLSVAHRAAFLLRGRDGIFGSDFAKQVYGWAFRKYWEHHERRSSVPASSR